LQHTHEQPNSQRNQQHRHTQLEGQEQRIASQVNGGLEIHGVMEVLKKSNG
jgi:hypothetical protein